MAEGIHPGSALGDFFEEFKKAPPAGKLAIVGVSVAVLVIAVYFHNKAKSSAASTSALTPGGTSGGSSSGTGQSPTSPSPMPPVATTPPPTATGKPIPQRKPPTRTGRPIHGTPPPPVQRIPPRQPPMRNVPKNTSGNAPVQYRPTGGRTSQTGWLPGGQGNYPTQRPVQLPPSPPTMPKGGGLIKR
jgi:hypothetical protein